MRFTIVLSLTFLSAICVFGQRSGIVAGRIDDAKGQIRLVSAAVSYETTINAAGEYSFENVADGLYLLVVGGRNVKAVTVRDGAATPTELANVVTIGAGEVQLFQDVSKTVDAIDGQQMRDRADISLIDSLRTVPGLRVQQLGGFGRTASIKTRGLRNQDTAVLIDGIRFRDPTAISGDASPFLSDLTLTSVDRAEVLRGAGSSLYGTNATGGVVDLVTARPRGGTHGQISGAAGGLGLGRFRGNLSHGTSGGRFGILGAGSRTVYTKGVDGNDNAYNTNLQTRVEVVPFERTSVSARVFFSDARVRLNVNPDTLGTLPSNSAQIIDAVAGVTFAPDADDADAEQRSRFASTQAAIEHVVNSRFVVGGYYQGLATRRRNDDGPLGPGWQSAYTSLFDGSVHTGNGHFDWQFAGEGRLTGGFEIEAERMGSENISGTDRSTTRVGQSSRTLYVQALKGLLGGSLQLAGGARFQWFQLGRREFSAAVPAVLQADPAETPSARTFDVAASYYLRRTGTKFRAHVGRGYRVPSLYERFGSYFFLGTFYPLGNPALKPEHSDGIDAAVEQYVANGRVRGSVTYFYNRIKDEITYLPTIDINAGAYYNFDRRYSRGVEAAMDIKPLSSLNIYGSYTFTNSDVRGHRRVGTNAVAGTDRRVFGVPDHQFTLVATQRFGRAWINFDLLVTSDYLAPVFSNTTFTTYTYRFRGNRRGDVTGGYTFGERRPIRVFATVENVFGNDYYENGFRTAGRTARIGAAFAF